MKLIPVHKSLRGAAAPHVTPLTPDQIQFIRERASSHTVSETQRMFFRQFGRDVSYGAVRHHRGEK